MGNLSKTQRSIGNWVVIGSLLAIAFLPVMRAELPLEVAKWHLASAANAVAFQDWDRAEKQLATAENWSRDIRLFPDFWGVYLQLSSSDPSNENSADSLIDKLQEAIRENSENRLAGNLVVKLLSDQGKFKEALESLKLTYGEAGAEGAVQWNQLAYYRALANTEIEQGLADIEKSLRQLPGEPSFLDTKAWLLYRQGKADKALPIINQSVASFQREIPQELREAPKNYDPAGLGIEPLGKLPETVPKALVETTAVIRYHRMKILEALGREEEALKDYRTLRYWGIEPTDKLY